MQMQVSGGSGDDLPAKENRLVKKALRMSKNGGTTEAPVEANGVQSTASTQDTAHKHGASTAHKSHRRRRHARGRVQLKKGNLDILWTIQPW